MLSAFHVLPLEIQLSKEEGSDSINGFNRATLLCLSQGTSKTIPTRLFGPVDYEIFKTECRQRTTRLL